MSKYTDSPDNFKLVQASEHTPLSKRNMAIFDMVMNRLGVPDHLHEFVRAVFLSGNWDRIDGWDEISLMRMARALATDENTMLRVYNRLKKNSPKFFKWQDGQTITIIDRVVLHEHTGNHKVKAKYLFVFFDLISNLWNLPLKMTQAAIRKAVDTAMKDFPIIEKPKRKTRRKKPESLANAAANNLLELQQETGTLEATALYFMEAYGASDELAQIILRIKDLSPQSGGTVPPLFRKQNDES